MTLIATPKSATAVHQIESKTELLDAEMIVEKPRVFRS